jgi:maltose alpha-D-glucosyltransferase / alpha-amylase
VMSAEQSNTSITYDGKFFLKLFRKVDTAVNPDLEITQFLSSKRFHNVPSFAGGIEWKFEGGTMVLGLLQELVESSSDAWSYMIQKLDSFNEELLSRPEILAPSSPIQGTLIEPVEYEGMPADMKLLLEGPVAEQAFLLGVRTGEMHTLLASGVDNPDFKPEPYSLHYQRSLYSGLQTLVRSTFENLSRNLRKLPDDVREDAVEILHLKHEILNTFKRIYQHKIDVVKIRIHGDYHLGQVLYTGKDFVITDFEGEPARALSERRLKRSPLRDVAGMVRSFHYVAYASLYLDNQIRKEDYGKLIPFVDQWYHYMSGFFMSAYLDTVNAQPFIPNNQEDLDILMTTFLLEKSIYELNYELNNRIEWVTIPLRGIKEVMKHAAATRSSLDAQHIKKPENSKESVSG